MSNKTFYVLYGMRLPSYVFDEDEIYEKIIDDYSRKQIGNFTIFYDNQLERDHFAGIILSKLEIEDITNNKSFKFPNSEQIENLKIKLKEEFLVKEKDINLEYLSFLYNNWK